MVSVLNTQKSEGKINNELFDQLKPKGSQPPRLYGLAKVHAKVAKIMEIINNNGSLSSKCYRKPTDTG